MRVIAGKARRIQLKTLSGLDTRPTTDRIKETLFNMIQPDLYGSNFLDLFSGSGAIGIEALSRGAELAVFVEQNPSAVQCIKDNLSTTRLQDQAQIICAQVLSGLKTLEKQNLTFDYIFMDPPYNQNLEYDVLKYLSESQLIHDDTTIIVEASLTTGFEYLEELHYEMRKQKKYKTNQHIFLVKGELPT